MSAPRKRKAGGAKAPSWPSNKLLAAVLKNKPMVDHWQAALDAAKDIVVEEFEVAERLAACVILRIMRDPEIDSELEESLCLDDVRDAIRHIWARCGAKATDEHVEEVYSWADANYNTDGFVGLLITLRDAKEFSAFVPTDEGLYFHGHNRQGERVKIQVTKTRIEVLAVTASADEMKWGRLVEVTNLKGRKKKWAIPMSMLLGNADEARRTLADLGLVPGDSKLSSQLLVQYLNDSVSNFATCVDKPGWCGHFYVAPTGEAYSPHESVLGEFVLQTDQPMTGDFAHKGTLVEWQEHIGRYCVGNPILALAVSAALAAPLMTPMGAEGGGIHIHGKSSSGKTTCMAVAGSVCGGPSFVRSWRSTANGLEAIATEHNDFLLCLDELHQIDSKDAAEAPYMLGNGVGKARAARDGTLGKPQARWRVLYLSSGELTLAEKLAQDSRTAGHAKAGQAVRFVEIPLLKNGSVFHELHGFADGAAFASALKAAVSEYHGTALPAYLKAITTGFPSHLERVRATQKQFQESNCPHGADGQVSRVAERFGLIAAAGELGTDLGVLPWPKGEATKAAKACFQAWLEERGGTGGHEIINGLEQVRAFLLRHGNSRFEDMNNLESIVPLKDRVGYRDINPKDGSTRFLVFPKAFRDEVCAGFDAKVIGKELVRQGMIEPDSKGYYMRPEMLPAPFYKKTRVVVILAKILENPEDSDEDDG